MPGEWPSPPHVSISRTDPFRWGGVGGVTRLDETALNRLLVNLLQHLVRAFPCAVRIAEGDAVGAEAGGDGRAFALGQVFEVQVAHLRGGVHDGTGDAGFLGGRIQARHGIARFAGELHAADQPRSLVSSSTV